MAEPMSMGALLGLQVGSQLLGSLGANRAARSQQRMYEQNMARRQALFDEMGGMELLNQITNAPDKLTRTASRNLESGLASFAQEEQSRIQEALAQSGATGASDVAARQRRQLGGSLLGQEVAGRAQIEQLGQNARMQALQSGMGVQNALFGTAGQNIQGAAEAQGQFITPGADIMSSISSAMLMNSLFGGGQNPLSGQTFSTSYGTPIQY